MPERRPLSTSAERTNTSAASISGLLMSEGRPIAGPDLNAYVARMAPLASAVVPTRGRPDLGDDHYREVARVYLEAWNSHDPAPTVAVAQTFRIPKTTAAKRVVVARRCGYLGPAVPRWARV